MTGFLKYVFSEVKSKRLSQPDALEVMREFYEGSGGQQSQALLHPLLHQNTSDLSGPQFSSTLDAEAFFLADHVVQGMRILPGVAYLEMALAGVMQASGLQDPSQVRLANVVWLRPMVADGATLDVHLGLYPEDNGDISFEIYSDQNVHSQGVARLDRAAAAGKIDIAAVQAECARQMSAPQCYALLGGAGLAYGPRFQALQGLHIGAGQVLARLAMPAGAGGDYTLHPSMMDGALQASLGLFAGEGGNTAVPFALGELAVLAPCTEQMWALVRRSTGSSAADRVQRLDIDVCDQDGTVCVRLTGLSLRVLGGEPAAVVPPQAVVVQRELQPAAVGSDQLAARAQGYFKKLLSAELKLPANQLEADAPLEKYGIDSVMVIKLTGELESVFGPLSKTLFFEYRTIEEISGYFIESHREQLDALLGVQTSVPQAAPAAPLVQEAAPALRARARSRFSAGPKAQAVAHEAMEVAIIGIAGRYPQAIDIEAFWQNLKNGKDCITEIPAERWDYKLYYDADKSQPGTTCSKWGGFIEGVDEFDPLFFNISPREAEIIDPQERLFLQCVYGALEDSGYTKETLGSASVGVFAGAMYEEYQLYGAQEQAQGRAIALSGSAASIANRISYYCNFQGPSMTLDTMCSSSLTAIHLACDSLQRGGCELAFAGGVNVSIHPNKYLVLGQGKFASSKGHCESFGEGGDGYVPGEGVGVLLLKPKARAIADGDHIYGIVKGTAINHGGKTNGYTVPNPNAQASVISRALKEARVDPRTVSYIEAHGTGTSLGDPIEIAGLNKAFRQSTADTQFCAIGSAKSNIGHCESAAGIAGVTKVLLQMRHRQLAPSLHSTVLNPNIDFTSSPFSVQQELAEWKRPVVNGVEYPRIAGISSFGAGGSNAHVVLEEYVAAPRTPATDDRPALVVLSARTSERLQERVRQLLAWLGREDANLADLAYTLQLGREPMDERLALVASSVEDLVAKLGAHAAGNEHVEDVFRGQVKRNKEAMGVFAADEDMASTIEAWVAKGKYAKLLELWVKGLAFDWSRLYGEDKPRRISLPSYPFARERYWVPEGGKARVVQQGGGALLHPLVHRNTSDLSGPQFSSTLDADAFYLADHVVQGRRMLPGVAYLEMALAGVMQASSLQDPSTVRLANVVWLRPMVADSASLEVNLGLYPEDNGDIAFEISSGEHVHSQGVALVGQATSTRTLDIAALQATSSRQMGAQECYALFNSAGLAYGPRFQALQGLYIGDGQVLAKLAMPAGADGAYILNPSVMDGALQASIGLFSGDGKAAVPFALGELAVLGPCTANMWALVRRSAGVQAHDKVQKLDIDVCDDDGKVCVQIAGLSLRVMASAPASGDDVGVLLLQPDWISQEVAASDLPAYAQRVVVLCGVEGIENVEVAGARCLSLGLPVDGIADFYQRSTQALLLELQALLAAKPGTPVLVQVVVPALGQEQVLAGLAGMLKTARQENPKLLGQLIAVENGETATTLAAKLQSNACSAQDVHVRYDAGARRVASWREMVATAKMPWKASGVYLITGGAGGLGMIFAREILRHAPAATLVVTGRSELDAPKQALMAELGALGARAVYRAVDVSDAGAVSALVDSIVADFGGLDGIIHSAGVTRDSFIIRKTAQECEAVLAPKVDGLVNLDLATRALKLDFLLCFSSGAGALGNVGQADYAAANAFMDSYAAYRNSLVVLEQRHGQTLSLNWPLWAEGGMGIDAATAQRMTNSTGLVPMQTASGIDALYRALASGQAQVMVLEGVLAKLRRVLPAASVPVERAVVAPEVPADAGGLHDKVKAMLVRLVSKLLKVKPDDIDGDAELSDYGFDSISLTEFGNTLNQEYQVELAPTIFFEYPTINQFARYLSNEHQALFATKFNVQAVPAPAGRATAPVAIEAPAHPAKRRGRFVQQSAPGSRAPVESEAVAIVGISGQFPMASDVDAFWDNLLQGRSCISEIPKDRWDWQACYGDPAREANKTNIKWGGFIDGVGDFDPLFFGISPKEAELMDPQQRLLMTHVWKAIEDAGYSAASLSGTDTALFVGTGSSGYSSLVAQQRVAIEGYSATGAVPSVGPNRMSYLLNIHGASEPIETACSSALVALRRGVQAIENGDSQMAIVGGVNTILTPDGHISFSKAGMLSEDGRCKTFSAQADGYVRGEGVGMLVLKKLSAAEKDGDHIYGLIRGSAENHGGRASSLTAPNPKAQAALLVAAYKKANIDPRSVSYIEAHGTGTGLGDPVEINGLKSAFKDMYLASGGADVQAPHCGLGSVKTNIGHLELAAGAAGVIKVLMQLKHKTLVKTLHCDTVNPYIDLKDSPFYLVRETQEWKPLADAQGNALPRRAGVSSFGFGGVNAHVVIEEYIAPVQAVRESVGPALVVLSAKNNARLQQQVQQLLDWLGRQPAHAAIADIAYTLQLGREPMEERLALIVGSTAELIDKLRAIAGGDENLEDVFRGQVKRNKEALGVFAADEDMATAIDAWVAKGKHAKLLDLWVKGLAFDWAKLYGDVKPRRISMPTYPFARERYWVPDGGGLVSAPSGATELHPLMHRNTSDFTGTRFSSTLDAQAFYLADHVVHGRRVLPGVACLEMALAGVLQASNLHDASTLRLANVVWLRPLVADGAVLEVHLGLSPQANGDIAFEVSSAGQAHSQGVALVGQATPAGKIDIAALQAQCANQMSAPQCYELLRSAGLAYGPRFQALQGLHIGDGKVLAKLAMPAGAAGAYTLHPSMMDGALQACLGLFGAEANGKAAVPFALGELAVLGPCTDMMWALVRRSAGSGATDKVQKLDIDVCDHDGAVRVRFTSLSLRLLDSEPATTEAVGVMLLEPEWKAQEAASAALPAYAQRLVLLCGVEGIAASDVAGVRCLDLGLPVDGIASHYQRSTQALLLELQALLADKPGAPVLVQVVVPTLGQEQVLAGLAGMLKSARQENPKLLGQLIGVEPGETAAALADKLHANACSAHDQHVRYEDGVRRVAGWRELAARTPAAKPWKAGGVYLITGGAGGLGRIFAREIAQQAAGAGLVITGRSALDAEKQGLLDELEGLGARATYRAVDVGDADAVAGLVDGIVADFGRLDGIIHGAGLTRDSFIAKKTAQQCQEVLAPKVDGLVNLDLASRDVKLDFLLCFSSGAGALGNVGQADYAAANAFMDSYAAYRNSLVALERCHGRTLSINWPLWADGGMQIDAATTQRIASSTGMLPMQTVSGINALYRALAAGEDQVMVLEGMLAKMQRALTGTPAPQTRPTPALAAPDADALRASVKAMLVDLVSTLLKVKPADIDGDAELSDYGFDSISLTQFGNALHLDTQVELSPTIFFEYPTLNEFAGYLSKEHHAVFAAKFAPQPALSMAAHATGDDAEPEELGRGIQAPAAQAGEQGIAVGFSIETVPGEQPFPVALYYPSSSPARTIQVGAFSLTLAVKGARPDAVKGLILISHGIGGNELVHHNLAQHLARQGYLVAAPQHPQESGADSALAKVSRYFVERPAQLSRVLDMVLADPHWSGKVAPGSIGAIGHSAGGASVLALAGAVADLSLIGEHCASVTDDRYFCESFARSPGQEDDHAALAALAGQQFDGGDPRLAAAIVLAPFGVAFTEDSLASMAAPLRIYVAEHDSVLNAQYHGARVAAHAPRAELEQVGNAGHFSFMATPSRAMASQIGVDPEGFDRVAFQHRLEHDASAFFDQHLGLDGAPPAAPVDPIKLHPPSEAGTTMNKIWLNEYPQGVPSEIDYRQYRSVTHFFEDVFAKFGSRNAYVCMGKYLTYSEFDTLSAHLGAYLQAKGLKKGARVAIVMPNVLQSPVAILAILRAGYVVVNLNPLVTPEELETQLNDSGAQAIVLLETFAATLQQVIDRTGIEHVVLANMGELLGGAKGALVNFVVRKVKKLVPAFSLPGAVSFRQALAEGSKHRLMPVEVSYDDVAFIQYTAGTTGEPIGAALTQRNIIANTLQADAWLQPALDKNPVVEQLVIASVIPLYSIYVVTSCCMLGAQIGALNILIPNPRDVPSVVRALGKHKFNFVLAVEIFFEGLLANEEFRKLDFSGLKLTVGGLPVTRAIAEQWYQVTGCPVVEGYGMAETSPAAICNISDATQYSGLLGLPFPSTEVAILDDHGKPVAHGEFGEIAIRGPQVMAGYWNRPEETAKVMTADGYFRSGDVGVMNALGYTRFVDRKKDMLRVGGANLYASDIERIVAAHPGVAECACVGVPDSQTGEAVRLIVVRKDPALTAERLMAYCADQLGAGSQPKRIDFRAELPRSNTGRVLRRALRAEKMAA